VAVEVTGNTRLFYDAVAPHVAKVVVVNPTQFRVIRDSVKKTDPHDARTLAFYLSKDMLPEGRMKFDAIVMTELRVIVGQIRACNASIAELDKAIKAEGPKLPGHENLRSIKGIGNLGATVLLSEIGDIADFAHPGKLAAYFGIVPRVRNSNETERSGRITKRGTKLGRTTLVQCALIAMRYSPCLAKFYHKIQTRRGTGKAIIALAKKFLGVIYNTLKNNWIFEDFPNFVLAEAS
jgi:transposase